MPDLFVRTLGKPTSSGNREAGPPLPPTHEFKSQVPTRTFTGAPRIRTPRLTTRFRGACLFILQFNKYGSWEGVGGPGRCVCAPAGWSGFRSFQHVRQGSGEEDSRLAQVPKARPRRFDGDVNLPIFTDRAMESQGRPITQRDCASLNRALRLPPSTHLLVQGGGEIVDVASCGRNDKRLERYTTGEIRGTWNPD